MWPFKKQSKQLWSSPLAAPLTSQAPETMQLDYEEQLLLFRMYLVDMDKDVLVNRHHIYPFGYYYVTDLKMLTGEQLATYIESCPMSHGIDEAGYGIMIWPTTQTVAIKIPKYLTND